LSLGCLTVAHDCTREVSDALDHCRQNGGNCGRGITMRKVGLAVHWCNAV